jgi:hypothetical protein
MSLSRQLNDWPVLEVGDIILTRGTGLFAAVIRWFGKLRTGEAKVNHAALYIGRIGDADMVIESAGRVRIAALSQYDDVPCRIWRMCALTQMQRIEMRQRAISRNTDAYGWGALVWLMCDSIFRTYWFSQTLGKIENHKVCSQFIGWIFFKSFGVDDIFGVGWRSVQPDTIDDHCYRNNATWTLRHNTIT